MRLAAGLTVVLATGFELAGVLPGFADLDLAPDAAADTAAESPWGLYRRLDAAISRQAACAPSNPSVEECLSGSSIL